MKLYSYWRSTAAYRVRIALNIMNIKHEVKVVDLVKGGGEHLQDEYREINPQKLLPTLELDNGDLITQSLAIIDYLDDNFSGIKLYPTDPNIKAKVKAMALSIACDVHPLNNLRVLKYLKSSGFQQPDVDQWYAHWIHQGFIAIEKTLTNTAGEYCFGDELTVADIFLVAQVYNANRFNVTLDDFPIIQSINHKCLTLDAVIKAIPENQIDAK